MHVVLIGLGSNRGDSVRIVTEAMARIAPYAREGSVKRSSLWLTSPVNCPPGSPDFVNAAVAFEPRPGLTPEALLAGLKRLEAEYGRTPSAVRNAPRELDLDLILFGGQTRDTPTFQLPHPRAVDRLFVLAPAAEIAADVCWPGTERTIKELLERLETDEVVECLNEAPVA